MNIKNQFYLFLVLLIISASLSAQIYIESDPVSWHTTGIKSHEKIPYVEFPALDMDYVRELEEKEAAAGLAPRIGILMDVDVTMETHGVLDKLSKDQYIWRLGIHCNQASAIALNFSEFHLPEGATLHLYNKDKSRKLGAYTAQNNKRSGRFSIQPFFGEDVILELQFKKVDQGTLEFHLNGLVHCYDWSINNTQKAYKDPLNHCMNDIICSSSFWNDIGSGVAMILIDESTRICSGSLLNNSKNDGEAYFLTANHCLPEDLNSFQNNELDWLFYWNYRRLNCNDDNENEPSFDVTMGARIISNHGNTDFALFKLEESPPANVFYNGFDRSTSNQSTIGACIHHPRGDVKKISFPKFQPSTVQVQNNYFPLWQVDEWSTFLGNVGITENGSSGSPLFNDEGLIIGQLYARRKGFDYDCNEPEKVKDLFGKLSSSWTNNDSEYLDHQLKYWLDPLGLNLSKLYKTDGFEPWFPKVMVNSNISLYGGAANNPKDEILVPFKILGGDFYFYRKNEIKIINVKIDGIPVPLVANRISRIGDDQNKYEITLDLANTALGSIGNNTVPLEFDIVEAGSSSEFTQHVEADIYFQDSDFTTLGLTGYDSTDPYIKAAVDVGIFKGFSDGFRPLQNLTKGAAAKIVCQIGLIHDKNFELNFDVSLGKPQSVHYSHEFFPYIQTLINNGSIPVSEIQNFDPTSDISYGDLCVWLRNTHLAFVGKGNLNSLKNYKGYSRSITNASEIQREAINLISAFVTAAGNPNDCIVAPAEVLLSNGSFTELTNEVQKIDASGSIIRANAAVLLYNMYLTKGIVVSNLNRNHQSDIAQYNIIGGKLRLPRTGSNEMPDPVSVFVSIDDDETYTASIPEFDSFGNRLAFHWVIKGGNLDQTVQGKFNEVEFTPPIVEKSTDFVLHMWVGNTKGNYIEGTIIITVNPSGANPTDDVSLQAENLRFRNITTDDVRIEWERGNGDKVLVTITPCGTVISHPQDGTDYDEDTDYEDAPLIGSSRIVYEGFGNFVEVTGLEANLCYDVKLYEFNGTGNSTSYLLENAPQENFYTRDNLALDFDWDPAIIVEDEPVDFDWISSTGSLSTENWTFEGGTPHTDNGNANGIIFHDPGIYTVTLTGYSGINDQTITIEKEIEVLAFDDFAPDFYFASTEVFPETCEPGQEVLVDWNISNQGVDHGKVTYVNYYFSEDNVLDTDDEVIAFQEPDDYQGNILSGGNSIKGSRYLEVPTGALAGTRYILCEIESEAPLSGSTEIDYSNNVIAIPVEVEVQLPDLKIKDVVLSASTFEAGETFDITIEFENCGDVDLPGSGMFHISYRNYVSVDSLFSTADGNPELYMELDDLGGGFERNNVYNPGDTHTITYANQTDAGLPDGNYFLAFTFDYGYQNHIDEEDENNNIFVIPFTIDNLGQPTIQAYDIEMTNKTNNSVTLKWERGNGDGVILMASQRKFPFTPEDNASYTLSTDWISASDIVDSSGDVKVDRRALYAGTDTTVTITGLHADESWFFSIYEYNLTSGIYDYLQTRPSTLYTYIDSGVNDYDIHYDKTGLDSDYDQTGFEIMVKDSLVLMVGSEAVIYRSIDNGESFNILNFGDFVTTIVTTKDNVVIAYLSSLNYVDVIISKDFGLSWERVDAIKALDEIRSFHILNENSYLVCFDDHSGNNHIYKTINSGITWGRVYSSEYDINHFDNLTDGSIIGCGNSGTLIQSYDLGTSWINKSNNIPISENLYELDIMNDTIIYSRSIGNIFKSMDGGSHWTNISQIESAFNATGNKMLFLTESHGFFTDRVSGDQTIQETLDGGTTWNEKLYLQNEPLASISLNPTGKMFGTGRKIISLGACTIDTFYFDFDQDGFGNKDISVVDCIHPFGYVTNDLDCDDNNALVNPDMNEICDNLDNDCDLSVDESDCSICEKFNVAYDIQESFEGNYGRWLQSTSDDFDWILGQDSTATGGTGPTSAIDSSSYLFVEATGNLNSSAVLVSACYDLIDGNAVDYMLGLHMYGTGCGLFTLEISIDQGTTWTLLESYNGDQGNEWLELQGSLNAFIGYEVIFRITAGTTNNDTGDIAIDYFKVIERCPELHYANDVPLGDGDYKARTAVISAGTIDSNSNIHYKAERYVKLVPGFHARELFISNIENCNN